MKQYPTLKATAVAVFAAASAFAATSAMAAATETHQLPELTVTAQSNFTETEQKTSANDIVFTEAEIKRSSATTLSDFLIEQGFAVIPGANEYEESDVYIRGFDTGSFTQEANSNVVTFLNGRRSGIMNVRQIALDNVERIEIIRGPQMIKYMAGSPGGIINIITKKGGEKKFSANVSVGAGSFGNRRVTTSMNGFVPMANDDQIDYSMAYGYSKINNYKDGKGKTVEYSKIGSANSFNGALGYSFLENRHRIGMEFYYRYLDDAQSPGWYNKNDGEDRNPSYGYKHASVLAFTYDGRTKDDKWKWNVSYSHSLDRYHDYDMPQVYPEQIYQWDTKVHTDQVRANLDYTGDIFDFSTGADFISYRTRNGGPAKSSSYESDFNEGFNINPYGSPLHLTSQQDVWGAYALGTAKLLDKKLNLSAGLRYEYARVTDLRRGDEPWWNPNNARYPIYGNDVGANMTAKRTYGHITPTIGATYVPVDWLKLRGSYFNGFRAPSGRYLFASHYTEGYGMPGNPYLKAITSDNYELGFDLKQRYANFGFTWFYSKLKNQVLTSQTMINDLGITGVNAPANMDERIQTGLELSGSADIAGLLGYKSIQITPYANVTYMSKIAEVYRKGNAKYNTWSTMTDVPKVAANYGIRVAQKAWGTSANLNVVYWGKTDESVKEGKNYVTKQYGKFSIVNFSIAQKLYQFDSAGNFEVKFQLNNMFNRDYKYTSVASNVYYPGRNFFVSLDYHY
jgi:outer membrane receptor protein involved in Fe transport